MNPGAHDSHLADAADRYICSIRHALVPHKAIGHQHAAIEEDPEVPLELRDTARACDRGRNGEKPIPGHGRADVYLWQGMSERYGLLYHESNVFTDRDTLTMVTPSAQPTHAP